jgi:hypothetical protein
MYVLHLCYYDNVKRDEKQQYKEMAGDFLERLGRKAVRYITTVRMRAYPGAGPDELNIRSGSLAASIQDRIHNTRNGVSLEIGSVGADEGSRIGWYQQEDPEKNITPSGSMYLAVPLAAAMNARGVVYSPGPRELRDELGVELFVLTAGRELFLAERESRDETPILYYMLKPVVKTKHIGIMQKTVEDVIIPELKNNSDLFKKARVYVRGKLVATIDGSLGSEDDESDQPKPSRKGGAKSQNKPQEKKVVRVKVKRR